MLDSSQLWVVIAKVRKLWLQNVLVNGIYAHLQIESLSRVTDTSGRLMEVLSGQNCDIAEFPWYWARCKWSGSSKPAVLFLPRQNNTSPNSGNRSLQWLILLTFCSAAQVTLFMLVWEMNVLMVGTGKSFPLPDDLFLASWKGFKDDLRLREEQRRSSIICMLKVALSSLAAMTSTT